MASLVLLQALAHADDGDQTVGESSLDLAVDPLVGLAEVSPSLGVANDHVLAQLFEHQRRDLASVGPFVLPVHVLSP
jgi:hypothetical protein